MPQLCSSPAIISPLLQACLNFPDERGGLRDLIARSLNPTRFSEVAGSSPSWPDLGVRQSSLGLQLGCCKQSSLPELLTSKTGEGNKNPNRFFYLVYTHVYE